MSPLPPILLRPWRLFQARRALLRGAPEEALGLLQDPCLLLSPRAEWMRSRTLDVLCRAAARKAADGRDASTARILDMVRSEDPERAERWRLRLQDPARERAAAQDAAETLRRLLADLRAAQAPPAGAAVPAPPARATPAAGVLRRAAPLAYLAVDDGGESLVAAGGAFVLGHARSRLADLPFLADVEREHARLARRETFHGGPRWCVERRGAGEVRVDGRALGAEAVALADGQELWLARNLVLRFRTPDPGSSSALLELLHGGECLGAGRVVLLVPGRGGRVRVGRGRDRHVAVAALERDLELWLAGDELVVSGPADLALHGGEAAASPGRSARGAARDELRLPWPLARPIDVTIARPAPDGPPIGLALRPAVHPADEVRP